MAFEFRQFRVEDGRCAMKVGTDGVLLGAWAEAPKGGGVALDLGGGSGLLSLMLAQRFENITVASLELDPGACDDCRLNFAASPWRNRLEAVCGDALRYRCPQPPDMIVSNPPFFVENLQSPDALRASARHAGTLSPESVVKYAAEVLSPDGTVALIFPTRLADTLIYIGEMLHLKERRRLDVSMRRNRGSERTLLQLSRVDGPPERQCMSLRDFDGTFTAEYRRLVEDFYLRMPKS